MPFRRIVTIKMVADDYRRVEEKQLFHEGGVYRRTLLFRYKLHLFYRTVHQAVISALEQVKYNMAGFPLNVVPKLELAEFDGYMTILAPTSNNLWQLPAAT